MPPSNDVDDASDSGTTSLRLVVLTQDQDLSASNRLVARVQALSNVDVAALIVERRRISFVKRFKRAIKTDGIGAGLNLFFASVWYKLTYTFTKLVVRSAQLVLQVRLTEKSDNPLCDVQFVDNHNSQTTATLIRETLGADLGIVYGTRILNERTFSAPRMGSLNIHKRKLPKYRGGGPIGLWELLDQQSSITVSIHWVAKAVDEGDLIAESTFPIEPLDTLQSIGLKADFLGERLFEQVIKDLRDGCATQTPQSELAQTAESSTYRTPIGIKRWQLERKAQAGRLESTSFKRKCINLISILRWIAFIHVAGIVTFVRRRRSGGQNESVVFLYYHLVSQRKHPMAITARNLYRQLSFLQRFFAFTDIQTAVSALRSGQNDRPMIVLTFDDGYKENFVDTRAVLESLNIPVCHFACSDLIGTESSFEHDGEDGRGFPALSKDELVELANDPLIEIGSHTRTHFDCGSTQDMDTLTHEIAGSKQVLTDLLKRPVPFFSFPWGTAANVNDSAIDAVRRANYEAAFTAAGGINYPKANGQDLVLKRLPTLYGSSLNENLCLLCECLGYSELAPWKK